MPKDRLEAFFDAVLAIIMTILILDLAEPAAANFASFWALRESYLTYALSFFWVGSIWINLYRQWLRIDEISGKVLWIALGMLFFISWIPYLTSFVGENFYSAYAQGVYGIVILLVGVCNWFFNREVMEANSDDVKIVQDFTVLNHWLLVDLAIKVAGLVIGLILYPPLSMIFIIAGSLLLSWRLSRIIRMERKKKAAK